MRGTCVLVCAVFSVAASTVVGCGPWRPGDVGNPDWRHAHVVVMDRNLKTWVPLDVAWGGELRVASTNQNETKDGRLRVVVELHNTTGTSLDLQVQTAFKDANGVLLEDETNWEHVIIPRRSMELYTTSSLTRQAKDYVVRIRKGGHID